MLILDNTSTTCYTPCMTGAPNQQRGMPIYSFTLDEESTVILNDFKLRGVSHSALIRLALKEYAKYNPKVVTKRSIPQ